MKCACAGSIHDRLREKFVEIFACVASLTETNAGPTALRGMRGRVFR